MSFDVSDSKTTHLVESHPNPIVAATEHTTNRMVGDASTTEADAAEPVRELHAEPTLPITSQPANAEAPAPRETASTGSTLATSCSDTHPAMTAARILEAHRPPYQPSPWRRGSMS